MHRRAPYSWREADVGVVARGKTLAAVVQKGLRLITDEEDFTVLAPRPAIRSIQRLRGADHKDEDAPDRTDAEPDEASHRASYP